MFKISDPTKKIFSLFIPKIIAILLLFFAESKMPIGYYSLMRYVLFFCFVSSIISEEIEWLSGIGLILLILFNPIWPIRLSKSIWHVTDYVVIGLLCAWMILSFVYLIAFKKINSN